jgi:hypothetical protein
MNLLILDEILLLIINEIKEELSSCKIHLVILDFQVLIEK